jgi:SCY1-like protein 3
MGADNSHMRNTSITDKQLLERLKHDLVLSDGRLAEGQRISIIEDIGGRDNPFAGYTPERPLTRAIKNLKIYRHPYSILKFLATGSDRTLVTEPVVGSLEKQGRVMNDIQVCLGIKNVLNALIFLVETAGVRHLNIAPESVFVTENSTWKLAGGEHIHAKITPELLTTSRRHRNPSSVDPCESDGTGLEQFAFASLCQAVIGKDSAIPGASEFLGYCSTHLKHKNASLRPLLSAVQLHGFFNHDFIVVHAFLSELPLKTQQAKQEFFKGIVEKLRQFDEEVVGGQLGDLLLSRLVLLDPTAQFHLLPLLLKPQNLEEDDEDATGASDYLFTAGAFVKFMVPKLKQVYRVLDVQIRLVLLEYFNLHAGAFSKEELVDEILPQLLLGIKDTNDLLVTKTLLCLADLIPIVGANQVIGEF